MVLLAEPGSAALTLTMRYVRCGAGVSTVSLRTHRIMALGDEDLPAARQSGPSLCILRDWALLAAAGCFSCRQECQARPSGAGARQEACAVCQGASDAKVRRLTWVQMGQTWHLKNVILLLIFLTKLKKAGREFKKLKIDPGSISGACLWLLIDKKVFQQLVINLK